MALRVPMKEADIYIKNKILDNLLFGIRLEHPHQPRQGARKCHSTFVGYMPAKFESPIMPTRQTNNLPLYAKKIGNGIPCTPWLPCLPSGNQHGRHLPDKLIA